MLVKDAALLWDITTRQVSSLCKEGKIRGAYKEGHAWIIPDDASKPNDNRIKSGSYQKTKKKRLYIPIGISDYAEISTSYYFVDKTLLIKEFLDRRAKVTLFTRPRRCGKTLNMSMLKYFFEKTDQDTSVYFKDRAIWKVGKEYRDFQGKFPVIFLSFKDVNKETWEETYESLYDLIASEYLRHKELMTSESVTDTDSYLKIIEKRATRNDVEISLRKLSLMLREHYGTSPVIIIDEYDTPIQQGYLNGYYKDIILFMRNLFSGAFKDNENLSFGFLTGILRVAKESLFSGLNNLDVQSILDEQYDKYFGFTLEEVSSLCAYYNASDKITEIQNWYDGYLFGTSRLFNPWSVLSYLSKNCLAMPYWAHTASNDIIAEIVRDATKDTLDGLTSLLKGEEVNAIIDTNIVYPEIKEVPSRVYAFLLMTGYLKANDIRISEQGSYICDVSIPNKEIQVTFNNEVLTLHNGIVSSNTLLTMQRALSTGDAVTLSKEIEKLLFSASFYDTANESFYHGFVLALSALCYNYYAISNRESGDGRFDIMLFPKSKNLPGIIIELKAEKNASKAKLDSLAKEALKQIDTLDYSALLREADIPKILKYGVAFSSKNVCIAIENS